MKILVKALNSLQGLKSLLKCSFYQKSFKWFDGFKVAYKS